MVHEEQTQDTERQQQPGTGNPESPARSDTPLVDILELRSTCQQLGDTLTALFADVEKLYAAMARRSDSGSTTG